jgi:hypothetical protein
MCKVPVHHYSSKNTWFIDANTEDWFCNHCDPGTRTHQTQALKILNEEVKVTVLLDYAPLYPNTNKLYS